MARRTTDRAAGGAERALGTAGRERAAIASKRGWKRSGGGYSNHIAPPPTWRGTSNQVCGMWPFALGAGMPLVGSPLG